MARIPSGAVKIVETIKQVAREIGWTPAAPVSGLARELDKREISSHHGGLWMRGRKSPTAQTLKDFLKTYAPELLVVPEEFTSIPEEPKPVSLIAETTSALDEKTCQSLTASERDTQKNDSAPETDTKGHQLASDLNVVQDHTLVIEALEPSPEAGITQAHTSTPNETAPVMPEQSSEPGLVLQDHTSLTQLGSSEDLLAPEDGVIPDLTQSTIDVPRLDETTITQLLKMLQWWRTHKDKQEHEIEPAISDIRPDFEREPSITRSVRISEHLFRDAIKSAKQLRAQTGGNFSGLVEMLLWQHLGCDAKYLKKPDG